MENVTIMTDYTAQEHLLQESSPQDRRPWSSQRHSRYGELPHKDEAAACHRRRHTSMPA
jgi:hypothetical protein